MSDVLKSGNDNVSSIESAVNLWESMEKEAGVSDEQLANAAFPEQVNLSIEGDIEKTESQPEQNVEEKDSKTTYYAKLSEKDAQIRDLKKKLKDNSNSDIIDLAKKDPMAVLSKLGLKFEDLLNKWAETEDNNTNNKTNIKEPVSADEIRKEFEEKFNKYKEEQEFQQNKIMEKQKILSLIGTDEKYELIRHHGDNGLDLILDTATAYFESTGKIPEYNDVFNYVEQQYRESYENHVKSLKDIKALSTYFKGGEQKQVVVNPQPHAFSKTTPTLGSQSQSTLVPKETPSARERYLSALKILSDADKEVVSE
jgi:hypothetical protein